jgi:hypothetical protein
MISWLLEPIVRRVNDDPLAGLMVTVTLLGSELER